MSETLTKQPEQARSKILRLAFADRMAFNRMIRDGYKGRALVTWLAEHGVSGVNGENLRKYRKSKEFRAWLAEEADVDRDREAAEQSMRLASALGGSASEKIKAMLAGKVYRLLQTANGTEETGELVGAVQAIVSAERIELQRHALRQRDEQLSMQRDAFEVKTCELFLKWFADERARTIAESPTTNSEKIAAMRREFYSDVDAMESAGEVQLPK